MLVVFVHVYLQETAASFNRADQISNLKIAMNLNSIENTAVTAD